jgi:hypothetical protein
MDDTTTAETQSENKCDMHTNEALNTALVDFGVPKRSKRAKAEAERRAKKKYAERWHKSLGGREQVSDVRGYSGAAPEPKEPAFNRPSVGDWAPTYPATAKLGDLRPFAYALTGYDPDRVADEDYPWCVP